MIAENRPAPRFARRRWHSRTAACSTTAAHQQRARVHWSVCEKLSRGGVLPAFFSRARQAGQYGKWPGAVRFPAEIFRELAPGREDDIAIYEKLYARGVLD